MKTSRRKRLLRVRKRECHDPRVEHFQLANEHLLIVGPVQASLGKGKNKITKIKQGASKEEKGHRAQEEKQEGSAHANLQAGRRRGSPGFAWRREHETFDRSILEARPRSSRGIPRRPREENHQLELQENSRKPDDKRGTGGEMNTTTAYTVRDPEWVDTTLQSLGVQARRRSRRPCRQEHLPPQGDEPSEGSRSGFPQDFQQLPPPDKKERPATNEKTLHLELAAQNGERRNKHPLQDRKERP